MNEIWMTAARYRSQLPTIARPRRLDRRAGNPDARSLEHRAGCGGEAGVPVVQDELCPCPSVFPVHEQVPGLLHYLQLDRMPGGSEDPDAAGAVPGDGKDAGLRAVEQAGGEEVQCQDPLRLGPEELRPARAIPARSPVDPGALEDLPDRGWRHRDAGPRELAVDPPVSPRLVLPGQPPSPQGAPATPGPATSRRG